MTKVISYSILTSIIATVIAITIVTIPTMLLFNHLADIFQWSHIDFWGAFAIVWILSLTGRTYTKSSEN